MKLKLTLEYDGSRFSGWQIQEGQLTVQGVMEAALCTLIRSEARRIGIDPPETPSVSSSGRTDRGVHARGQVASFLWPTQLNIEPERIRRSLNGIMRHQVFCLDVAEVSDEFDARHSPHLKCYSYRIRTRPYSVGVDAKAVWCVGPLDAAAMIVASRALVGTHDFSSFRAADCMAKSTERTILVSELTREASLCGAGDLVYTICGKGFLKQMVRIIVGTLVEIGRGRREATEIQRLLEVRDRAHAGPTAPSSGLTLEWVKYLDREYWESAPKLLTEPY